MIAEVKSEPQVAFEEFQLYYESTEKVTERRIDTNRWNYSICTTIITVDGALLSWAIGNPQFALVSLIGVIVLSFMAGLYCSLWIAQIRDFKQLNHAKFQVLNNMAKLVKFSQEEKDIRSSYQPFEKEWELLKQNNAVQEMYRTNIIALNSSNIEYAIPAAFRILFLIIILATFVIAVRNWDVIMNAASLQLPPLTATPAPIPSAVPTITP